jgi:hypothetical protein
VIWEEERKAEDADLELLPTTRIVERFLIR